MISFQLAFKPMLFRQSTAKLVLRSLACFLGLLLWPAGVVFGFELPQIYFTDCVLDRIQAPPGGKIAGSIALWNYEAAPLSDLRLGYELSYGPSGAKKILDLRTGVPFALAAGERRSFKFEYWLPYKLPSQIQMGDGGLTFRVKVANSLGTVLAWTDKIIYSDATGVFFTLDYLADPASKNPGILSPGESPEVRFNITLPPDLKRSEMISKVVRYQTCKKISESCFESELPLELEAASRKTIAYRLPVFREPGFYRTVVRMVNKGSGDIVSNSLEYVWIVKESQGNAQIHYALLDKDTYPSGSIASLRVGFSAVDWIIGADKELSVAAKILAGDGAIAGEAVKSVKMSDREALLRIPITKEADSPKASLILSIGGHPVDNYEFLAKEQEANSPEGQVKIPEPVLPGFWPLFFARFSLYIAVFSGFVLISAVVYGFKVIAPYLKAKKRLRSKKKFANKSAVNGGSLGALLDEFDEIEKRNKRFKSPK